MPKSEDIILKKGDKGRKVRIAQKCLRASGSSIKVTSIYTIGMASAVSSYQRKMGLIVNGNIIERMTWTALKSELPFWRRLF